MNLSASMLLEVPQNKLAGVIAIKGSSTSHTAILASAPGVPAYWALMIYPLNLLMA